MKINLNLEKMAGVEMSEKEAGLLNRFMRFFLRTWTVLMVSSAYNNLAVFISGFPVIELHLKLILIVFPDTLLTRIMPCFAINPAFAIAIFWNGLALIIGIHFTVSLKSFLTQLA